MRQALSLIWVAMVSCLVDVASPQPTAGAQPPGTKPDLAALLKQLKSQDAAERLAAVTALADHGPQAKAAVPDLLEALQQGNEHLRLNAAITLGRIGKVAVPPLTRLLTSKEAETRLYAVWALAWVGPEATGAAREVVALLTDPNADVRRKAAHALGRIAPDPNLVVPALLRRLDEPDEAAWKEVPGALLRFRKQAIPGLSAAVSKGGEMARRRAAEILGTIGPDAADAIPALRRFLLAEDGDPEVAAKSLGQIGRASLEVLSKTTKDERPAVRAASYRALAVLGAEGTVLAGLQDRAATVRRLIPSLLTQMRAEGREVVLALAGALRDQEDVVRAAAAFALRSQRDTSPALPALLQALSDNNDLVRESAVRAVRNARPDSRLEMPILVKLMQDKDHERRRCAVQLLYRHGSASVPHYVAALQDSTELVRWEALTHLRQVEGDIRKALPGVVPFLKSPQRLTRQYAAELLGRMGEAALPHLIEMLDNEDYYTRVVVVQAIGALGPAARKAAPQLLARFRQETQTPAQAGLATALLRMGPEQIAPVLEAVARVRDPYLRGQVLTALVNPSIPAKDAVPHLIKGLKDSFDVTRRSAADALGSLGPAAREAIPALEAARSDREDFVRRAVEDALRRIQARERRP
ncbi:MAG: HEAT repeat domain-containing protein [Gemmataceae bacterium]|nr:HEAT repeat domain-containing protein [Gemmataceae bacterium]